MNKLIPIAILVLIGMAVSIVQYLNWREKDDQLYVINKQLRGVELNINTLNTAYEGQLRVQHTILEQIAQEMKQLDNPTSPKHSILLEHRAEATATIDKIHARYKPELDTYLEQQQQLQRQIMAVSGATPEAEL